ncbi:SDR family oxidoreductase [Paenibacillus lutimineralis]|uniref:SDR family oxidoreductase n=1 Tax=Paenibacillus lutimineralis TaxID=2707005 RepID=A0A3Q9I9E0_9BACL|nr:SDR family oxidoreductase [Paenibacillus lutimineralis]AZS15708.1 SDR family oxidoreductase [Paenibacillus lutimineralis]
MSINLKVALITGANKGIGFQTARQLGQLGYMVLVGARDEERGREAEYRLQQEGLRALFIQLDVTQSVMINQVWKRIKEQYGKLDVLINNAAVASTDPHRHQFLELNMTDMRETLDTNFFGAMAVTQAVLPLMLESPAGRIVNVSSAMGSLTLNSNPRFLHYAHKPLAYNVSKTALNQLTVHLAHEFKNTNVKVNAACPGFASTDLNQGRGQRTASEAADIVVKLATLSNDGPTGKFFNAHGEIPW